MCGFFGSAGGNFPSSIIEKGLEILRHRGPDDSNIVGEAGWIVGFNRLSINDLRPSGMQPFKYDGITVWCNGEIYNSDQLRKEFKSDFLPTSNSDCEILPFLFNKFGIAFLDKLNGMFSMVILDERHGELFLVKDRYGKKPLYYILEPNCIIFSSEIKAFEAVQHLEVDPVSLATSLVTLATTPPFTLFKGISQLGPGQYLRYQIAGKQSLVRDWYSVFRERSQIKFESDAFVELFTSAVKLRAKAEVPVGLFLSGGLDSNFIFELLRREFDSLDCFICSIDEKSFFKSKEGLTDVDGALQSLALRGVSGKETGVGFSYWNDNLKRMTYSYEELFLDSGNMIFYALSELAHENGQKVVMTGVGADELFGGYPFQSRALSAGRSSESSVIKSIGWFTSKMFGRFGSMSLKRKIFRFFQRWGEFPHFWASLNSMYVVEAYEYSPLVRRRLEEFVGKNFPNAGFLDWGNRINSANFHSTILSQNHKVDIATMNASIEARSPFLDYRVVDYMLSVSHLEKIKLGPKGLLRLAGREILAPSVLRGKKSGPSSPVNLWFKKLPKKIIGDYLANRRDLVGDYLPFLCDRLNHNFAGVEGSKALHDFIVIATWLDVFAGNESRDLNAPVFDV